MTARAAQDRDTIDRAIEVTSWLGAFAMFAYGAALSFDVLHSIAQAAGLSPVLAWLWPLGFETFMAVAAVAILAEQRTRPGRTPWYPWVLTGLAAGSSIALNFGHPYIPLDPPPRLLVACVYGVPPITAPFAWHLFLLRLAHRRQDGSQRAQDTSQDTSVPAGRQDQPAAHIEAAAGGSAGNGQDGEPSRVLVRVLLAGERQDRLVSWQDVAAQTGLSRSRAYALLREERARLAAGNGRQPTLDLPRPAAGGGAPDA
jgi:predicted DNA-binding transcriptional regulator AlpA